MTDDWSSEPLGCQTVRLQCFDRPFSLNMFDDGKCLSRELFEFSSDCRGLEFQPKAFINFLVELEDTEDIEIQFKLLELMIFQPKTSLFPSGKRDNYFNEALVLENYNNIDLNPE